MANDWMNRAVVLIVLVFGVFVPICYSVELCSLVFKLVTVFAVAEWLWAVTQSRAHSVVKLFWTLVGLPSWAVPAWLLIDTVLSEWPGHRRTMECLAIVVIVSDSAQLMVGRAFGTRSHKAFPSVSPKKSIEGYVGGISIATIYASLVHGWAWQEALVALISGCCGDLLFSSVKRSLKIKDFSNALGAHGGVCDRIDSFLVATFCLWFFCRDNRCLEVSPSQWHIDL